MDLPRLEPVSFAFAVLDGPDPGWHVRRLHWQQRISEPYEIVVELITADVFVAVDDLLGAAVELTIERNGASHVGHGLVHRIDELGIAGDRLGLRAYVVPALKLLEQRIDTRIFQGQTVPEIVEAVLGPALGDYERELDLGNLQGSYEPRDCCVQYRESDFDFCSRLLQEEGIAYAFEPDLDNSREKLVFFDDNLSYGEVGLVLGDEIPIIPDRPEQADRESLRHLELVRRERITKVATRGFNWKVPSSLDEGEEEAEDPRGRTRELYLFDDRRQIVDDPLGDPQADSVTGEEYEQRRPLATRRLQLERRFSRTLEGDSNVTGLAAGLRFNLGEHRDDSLAGHNFLLTRVVHIGDAPEQELGESAGAGPRYANSFECLPVEVPFRPSLHAAKPRVYGATTAIVMGPPDDAEEDIHTDQHGRIKVRFHWDRISPEDESASCWVRVAQLWAGNGWGGMFIPRVGMEVVVDFLDGNPDRPLVIGCVYNGSQRPPYPLPDEKTKSTIKSDSSPGGGGFNELRFEDAKGSEQIYLHAQKDFDEEVLNNHTTRVDVDQSNTVGGNQTNTVSGDQTESITGKQTMSVEKNRKVTITGSQSVSITGAQAEDGVNGSKLDITGDYKVDASNTIAIQAPTEIKLTCGGSTLTMVPGKITLTAGGAATLVLDANALMQSSAGTKVLLDGNALAQSSGGSKILLDGNALAQSSGGSKVLLDANVLAQSSGGSKVLLDGNALMNGVGTATVSAPTSTLAGGGGSVEAGGAGVTCAGGQVNVSGGMVNVSGGLVKIN